MQKSKITRIAVVALVLLFLVLSVISCTTTHVHNHNRGHHHSGKKMPPGQAKKMKGDKSAKGHARGHHKKR